MRVYPVEWPGAGRLAVVSRPSPETAAAEIEGLKAAGYDTLVSLLAYPETEELGLNGERAIAERYGLRFVEAPVADYSIPDRDSFRALLFDLHDHYRGGGSIAAHCRASVGRAPLLIAALLVLDGCDWEDAWRRISLARGVPVPDTDAQRQWIRSFAARA